MSKEGSFDHIKHEKIDPGMEFTYGYKGN